jgi:hypothetical protein
MGTLEAVQTFLKQKANERRLIMASNARLRNCVFMLALLGGTAIMSQNARADSVQGRGDFGGTWTRIEPSDQERWRNHYYSAPIYAAPSYGYGPSYYEPDYYGPTYYDYGPGVMFDGPSIGVVID